MAGVGEPQGGDPPPRSPRLGQASVNPKFTDGVDRWQASVNPKAETVEELQGRRKALHVGMMKLVREDLSLLLQAGIDAHTVLARPPRPALVP